MTKMVGAAHPTCFKPDTVYPAQRSIRLGGDGRKSTGGPKGAGKVSGTAKRQEAARESRVNRKSADTSQKAIKKSAEGEINLKTIIPLTPPLEKGEDLRDCLSRPIPGARPI